MREALKNNGRLTVELYDEKGVGHGEIESGYTLTEPPAAGDASLPDIPGIMETGYIEHQDALDGQRFLDTGLEGLAAPRMTGLSAAAHNGKAFIVYALDLDGDPRTEADGELVLDSELFMRVYDFADGTFTPPIRLTDNMIPDTNPHIVEYEGEAYLFWNSDGYLTYLDLDALVQFGLTEETIDGVTYYRIKDNYGQYHKAFAGKNAAAESFTVTLGGDGSLYLTWSETVQRVVYVKDDASETGERAERSVSRQLFATMYDARFRQLGQIDSGEGMDPVPVYQGGWGGKWQLTGNPAENNNEQAVAVDTDGTVTIVNRKYDTVENGDGAAAAESDTSVLVARRFEPMSTLTIEDKDIEVYPQYPRPGESAAITVRAKDDGFMPSGRTTFRLDLTDAEDNATPLCEDIVIESHLASGAEIAATATFRVPADISDAQIRIRAWEGDVESTATQKYCQFPADYHLVIENQGGYFVSRDEMRLTATVLNLGNVKAENVTLTVERYDDEAMTRALLDKTQALTLPAPVLLKTIHFPVADTRDKFEINELIDVAGRCGFLR